MKASEIERILPKFFYGAARQRDHDGHGKLCWTYRFNVAVIDVDCMAGGVRVEMCTAFIKPMVGSVVRRKLQNKDEILTGLNDVWFGYREAMRFNARVYWGGDTQLRVARFLAIEDNIPTIWERLNA